MLAYCYCYASEVDHILVTVFPLAAVMGFISHQIA